MKNNKKKTSICENGYFINEEKGVVVYCHKANGTKYYGKSKCHTNDTFDIETGKKIARTRAVLASIDDNIDTIEYAVVAAMSESPFAKGVANRFVEKVYNDGENELKKLRAQRNKLKKWINEAISGTGSPICGSSVKQAPDMHFDMDGANDMH